MPVDFVINILIPYKEENVITVAAIKPPRAPPHGGGGDPKDNSQSTNKI